MPRKLPGLERIDRRSVLKGLGASAIGIGGATGVASAHHVQELQSLNGVPGEVVAGESFSFTVDWLSGHGGEACFVAAIGKDGSWIQVGRKRDQADGGFRSDESTTMQADIPESARGTYTFRVSATEWRYGGRCPDAGETANSGANYVQHIDRDLEVLPPVDVQDVEFKGCGQVWVAFDDFPVDSTSAQVNVGGDWNAITINESDLTKIPGHYGHDTPVFKYSGNGKLVGFRIVGEEYTNTHRCAKNV